MHMHGESNDEDADGDCNERPVVKALLSREPGGPGTLELADVPDPTPGPVELLVRVRAAATIAVSL